MKKHRSILEGNLIQVLEQTNLRKFKDKVEKIKKNLLIGHDMNNIQGVFNNPQERLSKLDDRELMLFAEQVYFQTHHIDEIDIENFYYPSEIDEARHFSANTFREEQFIEYPIIIGDAKLLNDDTYSIVLDIKTINQLLNSGILYYDPELQRETTKTRRYGMVIEQPTLVKKNVDEIAEHLLKGTLASTTLWFNAMPGSSLTGDEIIFKNGKLTITANTRIAIGDGFHRITGVQNALTINPDINFNFQITLSNFEKRKARVIQAQLAKGTPISKVKVEALEEKRLSDKVVQKLKEESDLKDKIVDNSKVTIGYGELVSYSILANAIHEEFDLKTSFEAKKVGDYLVEAFNNLLGLLPEEFLFNAEEISKNSFINFNHMFIGYVTLARRMYEYEINPDQIVRLIKQIDFSKTNPLWKEIGLMNNKNQLSTGYMKSKKLKNNIKKIFEEIKLNGETVQS